ncbi:MAG: prenyltransferase [Deltaproteobacteria bacterium]|nr:prenyltransferase [Deltaproteobacteria bacterium]
MTPQNPNNIADSSDSMEHPLTPSNSVLDAPDNPDQRPDNFNESATKPTLLKQDLSQFCQLEKIPESPLDDSANLALKLENASDSPDVLGARENPDQQPDNFRESATKPTFLKQDLSQFGKLDQITESYLDDLANSALKPNDGSITSIVLGAPENPDQQPDNFSESTTKPETLTQDLGQLEELEQIPESHLDDLANFTLKPDNDSNASEVLGALENLDQRPDNFNESATNPASLQQNLGQHCQMEQIPESHLDDLVNLSLKLENASDAPDILGEPINLDQRPDNFKKSATNPALSQQNLGQFDKLEQIMESHLDDLANLALKPDNDSNASKVLGAIENLDQRPDNFSESTTRPAPSKQNLSQFGKLEQIPESHLDDLANFTLKLENASDSLDVLGAPKNLDHHPDNISESAINPATTKQDLGQFFQLEQIQESHLDDLVNFTPKPDTNSDATDVYNPADNLGSLDDGTIKSSPQEPKESNQRVKFLKAWIQASRAPFFIATIFPLALGFTAAYKYTGEAKIGLFLLILLASFLVHLATNLANDYFDYSLGVDTPDTIGGSRVIQEGQISPKQIKLAILFCYTVSFLLAIVIIGKNVSLWIMVVVAAWSSFFYVAPPIKYGHRALGELSVFINMGLFMTIGTQAALTGSFIREVGALALPISFMVAGILYFQSIPEIETDALAKKTTLAGLLGKEGSYLVYLLWWPLIWLLMITLYLGKLVEWPALLGLLSFPLHVAACRRFKTVNNWLELDRYGHLIRKLYVVNATALVIGLAIR